MGTNKTEVFEQGKNVLEMSKEEYFCQCVMDDTDA